MGNLRSNRRSIDLGNYIGGHKLVQVAHRQHRTSQRDTTLWCRERGYLQWEGVDDALVNYDAPNLRMAHQGAAGLDMTQT